MKPVHAWEVHTLSSQVFVVQRESSKIFENLIHNRLKTHEKAYCQLIPQKFGFREGHNNSLTSQTYRSH